MSDWVSLTSEGKASAARYGEKASRLQRLIAHDVRIPPSWILDVPTCRKSNPKTIDAWAAELLLVDRSIERWILRSSSPREDRPDASAAGLFESVSVPALRDLVARALTRVLASAGDASTLEQLGLSEAAPLAVLAQPHLSLHTWYTVEVRAAEGQLRMEGWQWERGVTAPLRYAYGGSAQSWAHQVLDQARSDPHPTAKQHTDGLQLAARALDGLHGPWLLEMGEDDGGPVVLQLRPAPSRGLPQSPDDLLLTIGPPKPTDETAIDFPMFAGDKREDWIWDRAHSPTPLSPLLASCFLRGMRSAGPETPHRLIAGRWHDRLERAPLEPEARTDATATVFSVEQRLQELREQIQVWRYTRVPALASALDVLEVRSAMAIAKSFPDFVDAWLLWQNEYFDGAATRLRRAAQRLLAQLQRVDPPIPLPPIPATLALARDRELSDLAAQLRSLGRKVVGRPANAVRIAKFAEAQDHTLAKALLDHVRRNQFETPDGRWDGRGRPLREDAWPLWHELARRMQDKGKGTYRLAELRRQREDLFVRSMEHHGEDAAPLEHAGRAVAMAFALCEDDDALLARAYALWRGAAHDVARHLDHLVHWEEILDIMLPDLENVWQGHLEWEQALSRGRALSGGWETWTPIGLDPSASGAGHAGESRAGLAASPGRYEGSVHCSPVPQSDGGPSAGDVLVAPTILPSDGILFSRLGAVVAESGGQLDHAAVLARENGLPAVVGIPSALLWLRDATRVLVDGDRGVVSILKVAR